MSSPQALKQEMAATFPKQNLRLRLSDSSSGCNLSSKKKWRNAIIAGIIFLLLISPLLCRLLNKPLSELSHGKIQLADDHGCLTPVGMAVHALVFVIIIRVLSK